MAFVRKGGIPLGRGLPAGPRGGGEENMLLLGMGRAGGKLPPILVIYAIYTK
jgi:hypothetical protein